ncbi:MAG: hypothetical protein CVV05_00740 [Gammaproteobacteria bacterium HGW-Gammaproteobacteria-1]|jgi:intracellular multiplication protein IcmK|nr:MAG: hypothetical protein CVV05_00740 [Gammaproteobacteria bacterium HGW-Gammaproteobacteria-1]
MRAITAFTLAALISTAVAAEPATPTTKPAPSSTPASKPMPLTSVPRDKTAEAAARELPRVPQELYDEALRQQNPLPDDEVLRAREMEDRRKEAERRELRAVIPVIETTVINPGKMTAPVILRLRVGFTTTLVFQDTTGAPFPAALLEAGNNKAYEAKMRDTNIVSIIANEAYRATNLPIALEGVSVPLVLHLVNGDEEVDYLRVFSVQQLAPETRKGLALRADEAREVVPTVNDPDLSRFLDNIPPPEAQIIPVMEDAVQAWWWKGRIIARTRLTLLAPEGTPLQAGNGVRVYEILSPVPVLLFSEHGNEKPVHLVLDQVNELGQVGRRTR